MKLLATTTIIRGNGACKMFMDGIANEEIEKVNEELKKMKENYEKELSAKEAELEATKNHLNDVLTEKSTELRAMLVKPVSFVERIRERIVIIWCQIWGMGEALNLWSYDNE